MCSPLTSLQVAPLNAGQGASSIGGSRGREGTALCCTDLSVPAPTALWPRMTRPFLCQGVASTWPPNWQHLHGPSPGAWLWRTRVHLSRTTRQIGRRTSAYIFRCFSRGGLVAPGAWARCRFGRPHASFDGLAPSGVAGVAACSVAFARPWSAACPSGIMLSSSARGGACVGLAAHLRRQTPVPSRGWAHPCASRVPRCLRLPPSRFSAQLASAPECVRAAVGQTVDTR